MDIKEFRAMSLHFKLSLIFVTLLSMALLTAAAGTNFAVLGLLLLTPFFWKDFKSTQTLSNESFVFLALITALCVWDVFGNMFAGHDLYSSLKALLHDMRTLGFVVVLWAMFSQPMISRAAFWTLLACVLMLSFTNLFLKLFGYLPTEPYFWRNGPHLYGQVLVGLFFVLAQMLLVRPSLSWRVAVPMLILLLSLFLASERRTGYLLLAGGLVIWAGLNIKRLFIGKYKWAVLAVMLFAVAVAVSSSIVQRRMAMVLLEINQYLAFTPEQRAGVFTSVGIRMQFYVSILELIKQNNFWVGVGSIDFANIFWMINEKMGTTPEQAANQFSGFQNPHNEYLFMLATKGLVGLVLYVGIFIQACRIGWQKKDEVQRIGLLMLIFLFMFSITTNSMMTDMEEGHFTMLMLLVFLAPASLDLIKIDSKHKGEN